MITRLLLLLCFLTLGASALWGEPAGGVLLMGPPGAGKGTQGAFLQERYELHPLSPGDLLRAEVARGSALGKEAQGYMNSGKLVPDDVILKLVANELDTLGEDRGFLLDGFPRTQIGRASCRERV